MNFQEIKAQAPFGEAGTGDGTLVIFPLGASTMDISSPFVVISILLVVFVVGILYATGTKEDGPQEHD